jgi:hypothetical protein
MSRYNLLNADRNLPEISLRRDSILSLEVPLFPAHHTVFPFPVSIPKLPLSLAKMAAIFYDQGVYQQSQGDDQKVV